MAECKPLLSAILDGLKKRFQPRAESTDCLFSAAFHPHFKLSWISLLPLRGYEDVANVRIKTQQKMTLIVNSKVETDTHSTSCQSASSDNQFYGVALAEKSDNATAVKAVKRFSEREIRVPKQSNCYVAL